MENRMKRYVLSKIYQNEEGFWTHTVAEMPITPGSADYVGGQIAVDPVTGVPTQKALLVCVGGTRLKDLLAHPDIVAIPDLKLDDKVSSTHTPTKLTFKAQSKALLQDNQFVDDTVDNADGWRDVINVLGRLNNPNFDANEFDLND
jgi:hypothetical protein